MIIYLSKDYAKSVATCITVNNLLNKVHVCTCSISKK